MIELNILQEKMFKYSFLTSFIGESVEVSTGLEVGAFVMGLLLGFGVLGLVVGSFEGDSIGKSDGGVVGLLDGIEVIGFTSGDLDGLIVGV